MGAFTTGAGDAVDGAAVVEAETTVPAAAGIVAAGAAAGADTEANHAEIAGQFW